MNSTISSNRTVKALKYKHVDMCFQNQCPVKERYKQTMWYTMAGGHNPSELTGANSSQTSYPLNA